MKILLVTEKFEPDETQRDGGSRLIHTLLHAFDNSLEIMQFGKKSGEKARWHFDYPHHFDNRFEKRIKNANFIVKKIKEVEKYFTHIIFVHISMQFGLINFPLKNDITIITFPMFLTPSYQLSGEKVPKKYFEMEYAALKKSKLILTPSYLEKKQLIETYSIPEKNIRVIPRGIDSRFILPTIKTFKDNLKFFSIGSIKPQKNTIELISLFSEIKNRYKNSTLQIVGPIQNHEYYKTVCRKIHQLRMGDFIEFKGYAAPSEICHLIKECHLHLSTSTCETFGRSIFETLASGIPNIARIQNNGAAEFLSHLPYIEFVRNNAEALDALERILPNLEKLSLLASEIGTLYGDKLLSQLLAAEISNQKTIAISDFDGTLYHKDNPDKTKVYINNFKKFPIRIICSAREIDDLLSQLNFYNLDVNWVIASSGAIVTDGNGKMCWTVPLSNEHISKIKTLISEINYVFFKNQILQISTLENFKCDNFELRTETYQDKTFIQNWKASKLHAIHRLLNEINYTGCVRTFGDGKYDLEMLTYFAGTLV